MAFKAQKPRYAIFLENEFLPTHILKLKVNENINKVFLLFLCTTNQDFVNVVFNVDF